MQANCESCINAGFLFLRRSAAVSELVHRWRDILQVAGPPGTAHFPAK